MIILGTNSIKDAGGFNVANSLRFNSASSDYLNRTIGSSTPSTTWTLSCWLKRSKLGVAQTFLSAAASSAGNNNNLNIKFQSDDSLEYTIINSGSYNGRRVGGRLFRDTSAWYNFVFVWDTSNGTAGDRMKVFVNGVQETSFTTVANPGQNSTANIAGNIFTVGRPAYTSDASLDSYIAEVVLLDGTAVSDATSFGEFDDSGIWKPIKVSGLTFGTNGFYLEFKGSGTSANSSGLGADTSGNDLHFTVGNLTAVDQSIDTCTNNFATLNPLFPQSNQTLSEGNLKATNSTGTYNFRPATIGVSSGKWYAEYKTTTDTNHMHGVVDLAFAVAQGQNGYTHCGAGTGGVGYYADGQKYVEDTNTAYGNSYGDGDIIGIALDMDNNTVYFSKNGTFQNSGDPTSGASKTGAISLPTTGTYTFAETVISNCIVECNFGSPAFSISSGNTDGSGFGNFEYAVPSGYFALCTKNLARHGG